jgi:hypothetical protein
MSFNHSSSSSPSNSTAQAIKEIWRIKTINAKSVMELRAIHQSGSILSKLFKGSNYSSVDDLKLDFEKEALRLNAAGYNIYYVMNPIHPTFSSGSATDDAIECRHLLLIDIDRSESKKEPSTDQELEAARLLSDDIANYLKSEDWDDPTRMMSGNGYHLYYTLNMPNNQKTKRLIESALHELARHFDNKMVKVDTVVFNASRITKVPGTIARKGSSTAERPYRMAVVL